MNAPADEQRIEAADRAASKLGYILLVSDAPRMPAPITHMVAAGPDNLQPAAGRFLTYSTSAADAAEAGVEILRGIVERGDPWPEST